MASKVDQFDEAYEVVKTAILYRNDHVFRVEVVHDLKQPEKYKVHYSRRKDGVWVSAPDLPWVEAADIDAAMSQALSFV